MSHNHYTRDRLTPQALGGLGLRLQPVMRGLELVEGRTRVRGVFILITPTKTQNYNPMKLKLIIFTLILDNIHHKKYSDRVWSINKHGWLVSLNYLYALLNYHNTFGFNLLLQSKTNNIWPIQACIGSTNERWYKIYNSPVMKVWS